MHFRLPGPLVVVEQNVAAALGGVEQRSGPAATRSRWWLIGAGS